MTQDLDYTRSYISEAIHILELVDAAAVDRAVDVLVATKVRGGRLFLCGSGGGAGHASHATCDFRKLAGIESYSVSDNVSELTARINDDSWEESYAGWLRASGLNGKDSILVFSVGGGDRERNISGNLVRAIDLAKSVGAGVLGIVGRDGGYLAQVADAPVVVPTVNAANVTAQTEGFQAVLWHLLATHPRLNGSRPKWESVVP